jgi:flagellar basal-body rod protein FlgF
MSEVLAIALAAMHQDMTRLERIASNMANAAVPAYQADVVSAYPASATFDQTMGAFKLDGAGTTATAASQRPGAVRTTGLPLDLALATPGYFEVQTEQGVAYTRQGDFKLDAQGRLVTQAGHLVMGKAGPIVLTRPDPVIDAEGQIFESASAAADRAPLAQLKLVRFTHPHLLARLGGGLFGAPVAQGAGSVEGLQVADATPKVQQGHLEASNVQSMQEMIQLIQTMRHFESMQRVAVGYDELMGTAVRKLGDLS